MLSDNYRKYISFFLLADVFLTLLPSPAHALTVGAAAPEYTSFEPIDATSLVNPATGSFTYNLPLIEVPGPEGGYPLSLFNHAGIAPDQESSWTGLGWNLNPGAINRVVNGVPDDFSGQQSSVRDQWSGGTTYNGQVTFPLSPAASQTIACSWDTYQGFGIDYLKMTVGISGTPLSASLDSKGELGLTAGIGHSASLSHTQSINLGSGKHSNSTNVGLSTEQGYGVGVSLSSSGGLKTWSNLPSIGLSKPINNNFGKISTQTTTMFNAGFASLERTQYWMDQSQATPQYGILNANKTATETFRTDRDGNTISTGYHIPSSYGFDKYTLPEITPAAGQGVIGLPEAGAGPSFPAFDLYTITGQGTGGSMQPYMLENYTLFDQSKDNISYLSDQNQFADQGFYTFTINSIIKKYPGADRRLGFRLSGDFSNAHLANTPLPITLTGDAVNYSVNSTANKLGYTPGGVTTDGYDSGSLQLAGSSHVEYFTNREITSGSAASRGFISPTRSINRATVGGYDIQDVIGGFTITKADGITYHYALPVYTYDSHQYSRNSKRGIVERDVYNTKPYAYTWLLTAITGPDYVDQNANGQVDDSDLGYWTGFMYGKWTDTYQFRHPDGENEFLTDVNGTKLHSEGRKQLYYLDAIYTRTHTALFVKSPKQDGLGVASLVKGGFGRITESDGSVKVSTPTLKLDKVVLVRNESLKVSSVYNTTPAGIDRLCALMSGGIQSANVTTSGAELLTAEDMALNGLPDEKVIRSVEFDYDYSLCPQTLNSLAMNYNANPATVQSNPGGKLTLKAVRTLGHGNVSLIPATRFEYDSAPKFATFTTQQIGVSGIPNVANVTFDASNLEIGDIIKFNYLTINYYAVLTKAGTSARNYDLTLLNAASLPGTATGSSIPCQTTKNPPYVKKAYDSWGLFKSDYLDFTSGQYNNDITRITSEISAKGVDVWSLRKIITPLGGSISVAYESGSYDQVGVQNPRILNLKSRVGCWYRYPGTSLTATPVTMPSGFAYKEYAGTESSDTYQYYVPYLALGGSTAFFKLYPTEQYIKYLLQQNFQPGDWISLHSSIGQYVEPGGNRYYVNARSYSEGKVKVEALGDTYIMVSDPNQVLMKTNDNTAGFRHYTSFVELPKSYRLGGLRTASISVTDGAGSLNQTSYEYTNGVTSYEPLGYDGLIYPNAVASFPYPYADYRDIEFYKNSYRSMFINIMALAPELPEPGIIYSRVRKRYQVGNQIAPAYEQYEFNTFNPDMIKCIETKSITANSDRIFHSQARTIRIENRTALLGQLRRASLYDNNGNLLSETRNEFSTNTDEFANQGRFEQVFNEVRGVLPVNRHPAQPVDLPYFSIGTVSIRAQYPAVLRSTTSVDYKTGIKTTSQTNGYDFLSGEPTKQLASDGYGNQYVTETMPAYRYYANVTGRPSMGTKFQSLSNRHMLTQPGTSYTYKVDSNGNKLGLISASAQTWSDALSVKGTTPTTPEVAGTQSGIWRSASGFAWMPTGTTADGMSPLSGANAFVPFNYQTATAVAPWRRIQENTLYNTYSTLLESKDINGRYSAQKMGDNATHLFFAGSPASSDELAYSGAEEAWPLTNGMFSGGIRAVYPSWAGSDTQVYTDVPSTGKTHTGTRSLKVFGQKHGFSYDVDVSKLDMTRPYRASMWSNSPNGQLYYWVNGIETLISPTASRKVGSWYLLDLPIPALGSGVTSLRIGCYNSSSDPIYLDDFRFQPASAIANAYVYDSQSGELTDVLDNNNLATHYEYDAMGRLRKVYRESFEFGRQLASEKRFNYARNQKFTVQASANGSAQIVSSLPGGNVNQVELGGEVRYTVNITSGCEDKYELSDPNALVVDNVNITANQRLADGTLVQRLADGCILSNVRAAHTISLGIHHYVYDPINTRYNLGCEICADGSYTGQQMYKLADGCGGLLPKEDDRYYTSSDNACSSGGPVFECAGARQNQPYASKLVLIKAKAGKPKVSVKPSTITNK